MSRVDFVPEVENGPILAEAGKRQILLTCLPRAVLPLGGSFEERGKHGRGQLL